MRPFAALLLLLCACNYSYQGATPSCPPVTISVPYVKGDHQGQFTAALVQALAESGRFDCLHTGGSLTLRASIASDASHAIDWTYKEDKHLEPTENRRTLAVTIQLIESATEEILVGPLTIQSQVDYDFLVGCAWQDISLPNLSGQRVRALDFSLGQLDAADGASNSASAPLYQKLAEQIVAGLIHQLPRP